MKPEKELLGVLLTPGPNGAPIGKVIRVNNIREAAEKHISTDLRDVTSRYIEVAFDLPVSAGFSTQKAERSIHFANVTLPGSVLLFDKDEDCRVRSLSRAQIHAIAYFCASFTYSEE